MRACRGSEGTGFVSAVTRVKGEARYPHSIRSSWRYEKRDKRILYGLSEYMTCFVRGNGQGVPEYKEAAAHLILNSVSGVTSSPLSHSDVRDGTAVPAAYGGERQYSSSPNPTIWTKWCSPTVAGLSPLIPALAPVCGNEERRKEMERTEPF